MTKEELKECPFCGSSNVDLWRGQIVGHDRDNGMRFVRCLNCGASTAYRQKADAISSWNERAHEWSDGQRNVDPNIKENPYGTSADAAPKHTEVKNEKKRNVTGSASWNLWLPNRSTRCRRGLWNSMRQEIVMVMKTSRLKQALKGKTMKTKLQWITPDAEKVIAYCARVSSPHQDNPEYAKLIRYCADHGHWSIFEMANMCVEIETSRAISAQILRHRSFTFQEFSQRYQEVSTTWEKIPARRQDEKNRQNSIDDLDRYVQHRWEGMQEDLWAEAYSTYKAALKMGVAKECARMILPMQTQTRLYMNGTIRSWIHYLKVRTDPSTQKEHRDVANGVLEILRENLPMVAEACEL